MERKLILEFDKKQKQQKSKRHLTGNKDSDKRDKKQKRDRDSPTPTSSLSSANYRDRAKERRDGVNADFPLDPEDLLISNPIVDAGGEQVDEAEKRRQQIEESKYLGGDIEHTHLVKGLDFALYEKRKNELEAAKAKQEKSDRHGDDKDFILAGSDSDEEEFTREALRAATATTTTKRQIDIDKLRTSDMIPCRTALARRILNALDDDKRRSENKSELFQAGRMSYVLSMDEETNSQVTTIVKSKAEQAESDTPVSEKDLAFDQLIKIFGKIRSKKH